jgi:hypothetical protein
MSILKKKTSLYNEEVFMKFTANLRDLKYKILIYKCYLLK